MCVTTGPAHITGTRAYTYVPLGTTLSRHVTGYLNEAQNLDGSPNCMILHFPGNDLGLVNGPQYTKTLMEDMTKALPPLDSLVHPWHTSSMRSFSTTRVEVYGDYYVVLAEDTSDIIASLSKVPQSHRPMITEELTKLVDWYGDNFAGWSFVLACFNGSVKPTHPIVVGYTPHNDDVLFVPGIDAHYGGLPVVGQEMPRDFWIAFGTEENRQPIKVSYQDAVNAFWAPRDVAGFYDNRTNGPNMDYVVPRESVYSGLNGRDLAQELF